MKREIAKWGIVTGMTVVAFTVGACFSGENSAGPQVPETSASGPKTKASASASSHPVPDPVEVQRCEGLLTSRLREAIEIPAAQASRGQAESVSTLLAEARQCEYRGLLNQDAYRQVLLAIRHDIGLWYSQSPRPRAHALGGSTGVPILSQSGEIQLVRWAPGLAEAFLLTDSELERIGRKQQFPRSAIDADRERRNLVYAMMRVDAYASKLMATLDQQNAETPDKIAPSNPTEQAIAEDLHGLDDALQTEAAIWVNDYISNGGMDVVFRSSGGTKEEFALKYRFLLIAKYMQMLCDAWGSRDGAGVRMALGRPFRNFVETLIRAEGELIGEGKPEAEFPWVMPIEREGEQPSRDMIAMLPLKRILREVLFDEENLRAGFQMRKMQATAWGLLRADRDAGRNDDVVHASNMILDASAFTINILSRLTGLSRMVVSVDLVDGTEMRAQSKEAGRVSAADEAVKKASHEFRRVASRQVAEVTLCEMNKALVGTPPWACIAVMDMSSPIPPVLVQRCSRGMLVPDVMPGPPPIGVMPASVGQAYGRVLSTLEHNWKTVASAASSEGDTAASPRVITVSSLGRCEIARAAIAIALGRISAGIDTYEALFSMLASGRVELNTSDLGAVLSQGFVAIQRKENAICGELSLGDCSVRAIQDRLSGVSDPSHKRTLEGLKASFCEIAHRGRQMFEEVERGGGPTHSRMSLIQLSRPYLRPIEESQLRAIGKHLVAQSVHCSQLAALSTP